MTKPQNSLLFKAAHTLIKSLKKARAIASRIETKKIRAIGIILIVILTGFLIFNSTQKNKTSSDNKDYYEAFTLQEKENAESKFKIGIFIQKISAFDPQTKTFAADGYAWLKWEEPIDAWNEWDEGVRADPALTLEFLNAVEHWDFVKDISPDDPYIDSDGWSYQSVLFSGRFLANDIDLRRFPFESITLPIEIEAEDN